MIESDYQERGAHDYRKDACLTLEQFEKIILHCIIYYNTKRIIKNSPLIEQNIPPHSCNIWNYYSNSINNNGYCFIFSRQKMQIRNRI